MVLASALDWTAIIVSAIAAVPSSLAAWAAIHNRAAVKTPSKKPIGAQVESANALSAATLVNLLALMKRHGIDPVPVEHVHEQAEQATDSLVNGDAIPDTHPRAEA